MPPRSFAAPAAKTESAREARRAFYCDLCGKGYARQDEFEKHEASYDHQHRVRMKDLKAMNKTMDASVSKTKRQAEEKGSGLVKMDVDKDQGVVKKRGGGFKSAFGNAEGDLDDSQDQQETEQEYSRSQDPSGSAAAVEEESETDTEDEGYEVYDPKRPTGCPPGCPGRHAMDRHET